ncbi:MAG: cobalamin B12-binding domain-containing protein [Deltaproteobacteria bacterium]|nr:cobalamin B12-binding domain-containing protein [Deltaproteobacteria bacterium]
MPKRHRIMLAKAGLDGHDRGVRVVAMGLRDANFEVIYTGRRQTPEHIVNAAIQEDVDAIGLSILSGAHMTMFAKILELLKDKQAEDIAVFGGGIIPPDDAEELKKMGVKHIFGPGTAMDSIVEAINQTMQEREAN